MKVLIADDEAVSRWLLESSLRRWGYDVQVAHNGDEAWRMLQQPGAPQLVVFDWLMPGMDGLELCQAVRAHKLEPYTYIILLTTKRGQKDVVEGLEAGADDYISKPFDPQELKVRLRTGKRILYLMDQVIAAREAMRDLAMRDSLTGLWNRGAIFNMLTAEAARAARQGATLGVVLVDLDHFKMVNDTHGHDTGDVVLRHAADTLQGLVRPYDAVGRHGGEEFLVLLPGCDQINAVSQAERLRAALAGRTINTAAGPIELTASFGVTVLGRDCEIDPQTLFCAADAAMYRAKHNGRNRVEFEPSGQSVPELQADQSPVATR
jgi:diguanylate cyclase (GGDEF)-like protein